VADVYFAYEGKGVERRFWKVLRELNLVDSHGDDQSIKKSFSEMVELLSLCKKMPTTRLPGMRMI